jgi:hypothetical protein
MKKMRGRGRIRGVNERKGRYVKKKKKKKKKKKNVVRGWWGKKKKKREKERETGTEGERGKKK